jgi:NAD(P)-dependent dehydrogenase (short-subunit alcohol dehydrogenase family)
MQSLEPGYRAWVFGASGGIGSALVRRLSSDTRCGSVQSGSRRSFEDGHGSQSFAFDLENEETIIQAVQKMAEQGAPDLVIVATGLLHDPEIRPEKSMRALNAEALERSFRINAVGPALIAKAVLPLMSRSRRTMFAALSARVSSISDNLSGGWHAYRASKAALNMLIRNCAIEHAVRNPLSVCVTLHPGTVDTRMSKPFQSGVPNHKLFSPDISAGHLLRVLDQLTPGDSGSLIAWDGAKIPF